MQACMHCQWPPKKPNLPLQGSIMRMVDCSSFEGAPSKQRCGDHTYISQKTISGTTAPRFSHSCAEIQCCAFVRVHARYI